MKPSENMFLQHGARGSECGTSSFFSGVEYRNRQRFRRFQGSVGRVPAPTWLDEFFVPRGPIDWIPET
jgi:hypothetical protein